MGAFTPTTAPTTGGVGGGWIGDSDGDGTLLGTLLPATLPFGTGDARKPMTDASCLCMAGWAAARGEPSIASVTGVRLSLVLRRWRWCDRMPSASPPSTVCRRAAVDADSVSEAVRPWVGVAGVAASASSSFKS